MITVEMSDDIRKYENKTLGPFTTRQVVALSGGLLLGSILALLLPISLGNKFTVAIFVALPIIACGFVKLDGAYFETIALNMLYLYVLTPKKRKNIQKSDFMQEYEELTKKEEQIMLSKLDKAQKKAYQQTHGPNKKITYSSRSEFKVYR